MELRAHVSLLSPLTTAALFTVRQEDAMIACSCVLVLLVLLGGYFHQMSWPTSLIMISFTPAVHIPTVPLGITHTPRIARPERPENYKMVTADYFNRPWMPTLKNDLTTSPTTVIVPIDIPQPTRVLGVLDLILDFVIKLNQDYLDVPLVFFIALALVVSDFFYSLKSCLNFEMYI